ncbi:uncharacterized protein LOC103714403 [Phoenix dactylifera]|uniref:Uncharacterized protein LOC103714403 n=1 Tax=Phoenix dactylifera TaxID=42345 RepID=A0A8B7CIE9_PHODC|nr:uncharacterized protein LOC103714403 [Phoenix dactylifera]
MSSLQTWVAEHKLTSVGAFWASAIGASLAYTRKRAPLIKPSLRLIHARMHAQALTLAVLSGAALLHYYDDNLAADDDEKVSPTALV